MIPCFRCDGHGWLRREVDNSAFYGKPHVSVKTSVCPSCHGLGKVQPLPVSGKDLAAGQIEAAA